MDLTDKTTIKELLKKHGARAEKYLGQHFILSKKALNQMTAAAEIKKSDAIVEIGPGLGALTRELAKAGAKITAIEKDPLMISILKETLADFSNIKIVHADARSIGVGNLSLEKYKIAANLPYNIAVFLIRQWLEAEKPPQLMVLMVQKEVAQRICAKPPRANLLAASVQFYADAKIVDYVPAEAFWPKPKIDSAIIKIIPRKKPPQKTRGAFFATVKAGFSQPRKKLIGNLSKKFGAPKEKLAKIFKKLDIPENARAENLSLKQWLSLTTEIPYKIKKEK
ncbi:ribosomal RNA small subunit methyltransferase A [Candidatus Azambacteria bacterium]|nr:ribosomal RNA small subunit methyltransferase A [Candidatus Azambacteria bacterium]